MRTSRLLGSAAAAAVAVTTASAVLAPTAFANGRHHALPPASAVLPVPASRTVVLTPNGTAPIPYSVRPTLAWTIPACTGTVHAFFGLAQHSGPGVDYLQTKGTTDYACTPAPQRVVVTYSPVDPSAASLHTGAVDAEVTTYGVAPSPGAPAPQLRTATSNLTAVEAGPRQPAAATVVPTPASVVTIHTGGRSETLRWVVPACSGTVRASFALQQGGEVLALQQKGTTDYPCSVAPQYVPVTYSPVDPSFPGIQPGPVTAEVDTYRPTPGTSFGPLLHRATYDLTAS